MISIEWPGIGEVVVVAPTGSAAKTPYGHTCYSFFGFERDYKVQGRDPAAEATRMLNNDRFIPIRRRLVVVRVLILKSYPGWLLRFWTWCTSFRSSRARRALWTLR